MCNIFTESKMQKPFRKSGQKDFKQECIPVGCVPPAAVAVRGSPPGAPGKQAPPGPDPPDQAPSWSRPPQSRPSLDQVPLWSRPPRADTLLELTPWSRHPPEQTPQEQASPCGPNSWHTLLKILPCRKLGLRAVNIGREDIPRERREVCHRMHIFMGAIPHQMKQKKWHLKVKRSCHPSDPNKRSWPELLGIKSVKSLKLNIKK